MREGDMITVRAFFPIGKGTMPRVDGGQIDLEVEFIDQDAGVICGNILTELPEPDQPATARRASWH